MKPIIVQTTLHFLMLVAAALSAPDLQAQSATFEWATLVASGPLPFGGVADPEGNAIIASFPDGDDWRVTFANCVVIKVDARGNELWTKGALPHVRRLATDANGSIYVAGSLVGPEALSGLVVPTDYFSTLGIANEGSGSAYVAKLSPDGEFDWVRLFGNSQKIEATDIAADRDGSYYVAGYYTQGSAQFGDTILPATAATKACNLFVVKYAPHGQVQWVRAGVGTYSSIIPRLVIDRSGNVIVQAQSGNGNRYAFEGTIVGGNGTFLVKFDPEGKLLWATDALGGAVDHNGNFFLPSSAGERLLLNKYTPGGDLLWSRQSEVNANFANWASVTVDSDGNCFLSGQFEGAGSFGDVTITTSQNFDIFVVKYTPSGDVRWVIQSVGQGPGPYPNLSDTRNPFVFLDPSGGIFVGGQFTGTVQFGTTILDGPPTGSGFSGGLFARIIDPDIARPLLSIVKETSGALIRWPAAAAGFVLESAGSLATPAWITVPTAPVLEGDQDVVTVEIGSSQKFFRLRKP